MTKLEKQTFSALFTRTNVAVSILIKLRSTLTLSLARSTFFGVPLNNLMVFGRQRGDL